MPHTSRKKKNTPNKRKEVVDEQGWTRITSTNNSAPRQDAQLLNKSLQPMAPVEGTTLETMRAHFDRVQAKWAATELCRTLEETLTTIIRETGCRISHCVVFGSGSLCGDETHWIDRHESAYNQIAAFKTAVDAISRAQGGSGVRTYAQEPCYNDLDAALLAGLDITTLDSPAGFEVLAAAQTEQEGSTAFAYSPAAEPAVEWEIMSRDPRVWLHRTLDHNHTVVSSRESPAAGMVVEDREMVTQRFRDNHASKALPELNLKNFPFHGSVLWWRTEQKQEREE